MASLLGLSEAEATRRLRIHGPNQLPSQRPKHALAILSQVLSEPMLMLLLGTGGVYLALGDRGEATLMLTFVFAIAGITWIQEGRTRRALEALRDLSAPRALVVRDGQERRIPASELVPGDLIVLHEGDRVSADGLVLEGLVSVDGSLLTGESVSVVRGPSGDGTGSQVQAGTLVVQGVAWVEVQATGGGTALGRLGKSLGDIREEPSNLQKVSRRLVTRLAIGGLALASFSVLLGWAWVGRPFLDSLLQGLALAMAILPEEIPVVLTVFLAMGAWRMSHKRVLTRRIPAVETLGSITVLAVDKTGTLTQNRMAVAELWTDGQTFGQASREPLPEPFHLLVEYAVLASPEDPFDPMEVAIKTFGASHLDGTEHLHDGWRPERTYDLSQDILAVTRSYPEGGGFLLAAKGAPEAIADLCHLPEARLAAIRVEVGNLAARGLRVLGVARGRFAGDAWPPSQHDFDFEFLGLLGLQDPPRPEVPAAIAACRTAGIRVLMLTGDHPETARAIARAVGLPAEGPVLLGPEMDLLDDAKLQIRLKEASLCARVRPEQKLRMVQALQAMGEVVGMTGDGVNDAPALQAAHAGVAMGARGTDVAREAASLVLLDDSFGSLVEGVQEGRRIYANIIKALRFTISVHVPIIALSFLALALQWPLLLLPAHIVLLELIIDPACSVVLEAEPGDGDLMRRPPRPVDESPFRFDVWLGGLGQGLGVSSILALLAWVGHRQGWPLETLRTGVLGGLAIGAYLLVLANRSRSGLGRNPWVPGLGIALILGATALWRIPGLGHLMGLGALSKEAGLGILLSTLACQAWLILWRRLALHSF